MENNLPSEEPMFDYEAANHEDRLNLERQVLEALFSLWKVAFLHGPIEDGSNDENCRIIATALGLYPQWEGIVEYHLFEGGK